MVFRQTEFQNVEDNDMLFPKQYEDQPVRNLCHITYQVQFSNFEDQTVIQAETLYAFASSFLRVYLFAGYVMV